MNELLQRHGCSNVFSIPEGLKELMADISREVLRDQPPKIYDYIANYLSVLLITREHGILSTKILEDLCDCKPSVSEHLVQLGMPEGQSAILAQIIKEEVEKVAPEEGKEKVKEAHILKKVLARMALDEETSVLVCQVARNAYRDYWYRKKLMEKNMNVQPHEAWEVAAERTLEIYKRTKPSYSELMRATQQIQAAYRGYHVRRNLLRHLKPKKAKHPKMELPGPPVDAAGSREINLGPVINVRVREENTTAEFDKHVGQALHLNYDPMKTITHVVQEDQKHKTSIQLSGRSSSTGGVKPELRKSSLKGIDQPDPLEQPPYKLPHLEGPDIPGSKVPEEIQVDSARSSIEQSPLNKISFAERPHERFIDDDIGQSEVPEEILGEPVDDAPEIPEEIIGGSEPDADSSAPIASEPSSAPTTEDEEE